MFVLNGTSAADTFTFNAPSATDITLQGNLDAASDSVVIKVADIAGAGTRTLKLVTTGLTATGDRLVFDFGDASDTVVLASGTVISGFTTLEVKAGTVNALNASLPAGINVVVNSGLVLSVAQFTALGSVESLSGAGTIDIVVDTQEDYLQLTTDLQTAEPGLLSGVTTSVAPQSLYTPEPTEQEALESAVAAATIPSFGFTEAAGIVSFAGTATGAISIALDSTGLASFSREGTVAAGSVSALGSKQLDVGAGTSFDVTATGTTSNDTFTINAPNAAVLRFSGDAGLGTDEFAVRVVDTVAGYNVRELTVDTTGVTGGEVLSFIFDASAANTANAFDNDVVRLSAGSVISSANGFTTIKVRTGALDVSQAQVSAGIGYDIASNITLSYSQFIAADSFLSINDSGSILINLASTTELADLSTFLNAAPASFTIIGNVVALSLGGSIYQVNNGVVSTFDPGTLTYTPVAPTDANAAALDSAFAAIAGVSYPGIVGLSGQVNTLAANLISPISDPQNPLYDSGFTAPADSTVSVSIDGVVYTAGGANDLTTRFSISGNTYTALADAFTGSETVKVTAVQLNAQGTALVSATTLDAIDTTAPVAPAITTADLTSNQLSHTISGSGEAGSTITVLEGSTVLGSAVVNANGNWATTVTLTGATAHTLTATSSDAAGNVSSSAAAATEGQSVVITIDTTAPVVSLNRIADADNGLFDSGFSVTDSASVTITVDGVALDAAAVAAAFSSVTNAGVTAYTAIADAFTGSEVIVVSATQTDAAGNTGSASLTLEAVDTTAPTAPVISTADITTNNTTQTINGTAEAGATVTILDGATVVGTTTANAAGAWAVSVELASESAHSLTATQTDAAGNTSSASAAVVITVDTTAPVVSLNRIADADNGLFDSGFSVTDSASVTITVDGVALDAAAVAAAFSSVTNAGVTAYTAIADAFTGSEVIVVSATQTDAAGNTGSASLTLEAVDTTAPTAPVISTADITTNNTTQTINGTAEAGATVTILDGATVVGTTTANAAGAWAVSVELASESAHSLTATQTDAAGNTSSASAAVVITVDTTAPVVSLNRIADADNGLFDSGFSVTDSASVTITVDGVALDAAAVAAAFSSVTNAGVTAYTAIADAFTGSEVIVVSATQTDAAGNTGSASLTLEAVDTTAPTAPVISTADITTNNTTQTINGTAEAGATVTILDGATVVGTTTANAAGAWAVSVELASESAHSLTATQTDAAGNTSSASAAVVITVDTTAPVVSLNRIADADNGLFDSGFSVTDSASVTITVDGVALDAAAVAAAFSSVTNAGVTAYTAIADAFTGSEVIVVSATQTDAAGNTGSASLTLEAVDTTAPTAPVISTADITTNNTTQTINGTAEAGATVTILDGATVVGTTTANAAGAWAVSVELASESAHSLTATQTDAAGNTSSASAAVVITVDTTAPVVSLNRIADADNGLFDSGFSVTDSASVTITVDGVALDAAAVAAAFSSVTNAGVTAYTAIADAFTGSEVIVVSATQTDAAGNTGSASLTLEAVDTTAPTGIGFSRHR